MKAIMARLGQSRFVVNFGALGYARLVQIAIQLALVPAFANAWGLETYGVWLILFTIPSYLVISDFGLTQAATNDMIMARARGDVGSVATTYRTLRLALLALGLAVVALTALLVFAIAPGMLAPAQEAAGGRAATVVLLVVAYSMVSLQMHGVLGGLKASDRYAGATAAYASALFFEMIAVVACLVAGLGMVAVAASYVAVRFAGLIACIVWLRRHAPELLREGGGFAWRELRRLARPALAALALPIGTAISLQAMVVIVGIKAGAAAVPAFSATRTLTRVAVQLTGMVSTAAMPLFGAAGSTRRDRDQSALIVVTLIGAGAILLPSFVVLCLFGTALVALWTGGAIVPSNALVAAMAGVVVFNGTWMALGNLLLAVNRHEGFARAYIVLSLAALALAWWLGEAYGSLGAALALLILDALMSTVVIAGLVREGWLGRARLTEGYHAARERIASIFNRY